MMLKKERMYCETGHEPLDDLSSLVSPASFSYAAGEKKKNP